MHVTINRMIGTKDFATGDRTFFYEEIPPQSTAIFLLDKIKDANSCFEEITMPGKYQLVVWGDTNKGGLTSGTILWEKIK